MVILGIHDGHCAAACIMVDGALKALAAEERFTRLKSDHGYPLRAISYCLKELGITALDLDHVAFSGKMMNVWGVRLKAMSCFSSDDWMLLQREYWKPLFYDGVKNPEPFKRLYEDARFQTLTHYYDFSRVGWQEAMAGGEELTRRIRLEALHRHLGIGSEKVGFYDHHTCHAAYALYGSPIRDDGTMVYTLDGGGDGCTSTVFRFEQGRLHELARSNDVDVARIYRFVTLMMGMKMGEHEYKVMGLAPYAPERERNKSYAVFDGKFCVKDDLISWTDGGRPKDLYFWMKDAFENHRFDGIGAATQRACEVAVSKWMLRTQAKYASTKMVFAGGVAMNVKLNMLLADAEGIEAYCVPPSPSDDTLPIGASYLAEAALKKDSWKRLKPVTDPYMGPRYSSADAREAIQRTGANERFKVEQNVTPRRIAGLLADNKVVARLGGRMEFGQRALGNRSILADPRNDETVNKINHQIKYRDFWMPFAPVIKAERANAYLAMNKGDICRDYMMVAARTTPLGARALAAAIHKGDGTARPQVVRREQNETYYDIIDEFEKITGTGALLNTSFNLHGEPIVCSVEDAISTFERSELDVVVMEDVALMRE